MTKNLRLSIIGLLMSAAVIPMWCSCGDEPHSKANIKGDESNVGNLPSDWIDFTDWEGSVSGKEKDLIGTWYCTGEKWWEDGDSEEENYDPTGNLGMQFGSDHKGRFMIYPPYISLMERGSNGGNGDSFDWTMTKQGKEWVVKTTSKTDWGSNKYDYIVKLLDGNRLILMWDDGDFKIAAKFVKVL